MKCKKYVQNNVNFIKENEKTSLNDNVSSSGNVIDGLILKNKSDNHLITFAENTSDYYVTEFLPHESKMKVYSKSEYSLEDVNSDNNW